MAVARAIYGYPSLNKYAIDPAKPIRISVQNGHVALYGMVDSRPTKTRPYIRANGVPGVFSVKNYLQVAGQPGENEKSQKSAQAASRERSSRERLWSKMSDQAGSQSLASH